MTRPGAFGADIGNGLYHNPEPMKMTALSTGSNNYPAPKQALALDL